jgi:hypothetical protein
MDSILNDLGLALASGLLIELSHMPEMLAAFAGRTYYTFTKGKQAPGTTVGVTPVEQFVFDPADL